MYLKSFLDFTFMKIIVGSTNPTKIDAVREVLNQYSFLGKPEIVGVNVSSEVSDQPKSMEEIIQGAINRAKNAYRHSQCDYSIGLESGLSEFPLVGYLELTACIFHDGNKLYPGFSSAFPIPPTVASLVLEHGLNLSQASHQAGLTTNPELGKSEGIIGVLTKNRVTRMDYTKYAIMMAMIGVENKF